MYFTRDKMKTLDAFAMGQANRFKEPMVFDWHKAARLIKDKIMAKIKKVPEVPVLSYFPKTLTNAYGKSICIKFRETALKRVLWVPFRKNQKPANRPKEQKK